jgi:hypothetical protein
MKFYVPPNPASSILQISGTVGVSFEDRQDLLGHKSRNRTFAPEWAEVKCLK